MRAHQSVLSLCPQGRLLLRYLHTAQLRPPVISQEESPSTRTLPPQTHSSYSFLLTRVPCCLVQCLSEALPCLPLLACQVTSVVSDSVRPHRRQPTGLPRPWDPPGNNTGVGCHCLPEERAKPLKTGYPAHAFSLHSALSRVRLCSPVDCSPPGASARGGFSKQEPWSGLPCPPQRGSSQPEDRTQVSQVASGFFTV